MNPEGMTPAPENKSGKLSFKQKIGRIAATVGIAAATSPALGGCATAENKDMGPDYKPKESTAPLTPGEEQQQAVEGMNQAKEQEAALKESQEKAAEETAETQSGVDEATSPQNTIPPTSIEGLEPKGD